MFLVKSRESHKSRILKQLKRSGKYGSWTHELVKPSVGGHRLSSYIKQLRKDGYGISVVRINQYESKYYLVSFPEEE